MKKIFYIAILFLSFFLMDCSSSLDTTNMTAEEKLAYAMEMFNDEDYQLAVEQFSGIILQYPGNAVVDDAQFYLAESRFRREEYLLAAYEYSRLIKNMPASEFVPQGQFMLAECYYELSPDFTLDQRYTKKAIEEYQAFIDFFPTNDKVGEAEKKILGLNEKLAHKEFEIARIYQKMEYYTAALSYYNNVLDIYHDTKFAPEAMYNKIFLLVDRNRNREALSEITKFIERYPEDSSISEIRRLKISLENKLSAAQ